MRLRPPRLPPPALQQVAAAPRPSQPPSRLGPQRKPSVPELSRLRRHPGARSPGPGDPQLAGLGRSTRLQRIRGRCAPAARGQRRLTPAPPHTPWPRPAPCHAPTLSCHAPAHSCHAPCRPATALPPAPSPPTAPPLCFELDARPAAPPPARSLSVTALWSGVPGPPLSQGPSRAAREAPRSHRIRR